MQMWSCGASADGGGEPDVNAAIKSERRKSAFWADIVLGLFLDNLKQRSAGVTLDKFPRTTNTPNTTQT